MLNKADLVDKWTFKVYCLSSSHILLISAPRYSAVAVHLARFCIIVTLNNFTYPCLISFAGAIMQGKGNYLVIAYKPVYGCD